MVRSLSFRTAHAASIETIERVARAETERLAVVYAEEQAHPPA